MKKRRRWIKLWIDESLRGSIRIELNSAERGVWIDLLLMAGESRRPGIIEATESVGYPRELIAGWLNIPLELLTSTLDKCVASGRVTINQNCIHITNWEKYQAKYAEEETREKTRQPQKTKKIADIPPKEYLQKYGKGAKR